MMGTKTSNVPPVVLKQLEDLEKQFGPAVAQQVPVSEETAQAMKAAGISPEPGPPKQTEEQVQPAPPVLQVPPVPPAAPAQPAQPAQPDQASVEVLSRFERRLDSLTESMSSKDQEINRLRAELEAARSVPAAPLTDADIATRYKLTPEQGGFDPDLLNAVVKIAKEEAGSVVAQVDERIKPVAQQVTEQSAQSFKSALTTVEPGWVELNTDSGFLSWLDQPDPFSGVRRQNLLDKAVSEKATERAATFFRAYREAQAPAAKPAAPAAAPQPMPNLKPAASAAPAPAGGGKPTMTAAEFSKLSSELARGAIPAYKRAEVKRLLDEVYYDRRIVG